MDAAKSSERSAPGRVSPKTSIFWASNSCGLPGPGAPGAAGSAQRGTRSGRRNKSSAAEPGAALAGKGAGKTGPQHPPVQPQVRKSGSSAVIFRPEVVLRAPFLQRWGRRGGFTLQILPQQSGGFFLGERGGDPRARGGGAGSGPLLCARSLRGRRSPTSGRGGAQSAAGPPRCRPKAGLALGESPLSASPPLGARNGEEKRAAGGCRISFGRCEQRGKRSTHRSPARTGHGHRRAARSAPNRDPKYSPRAPESTPGSMGGTNASEPGTARHGTRPYGRLAGNSFYKLRVAGKGQGGQRLWLPPSRGCPVGAQARRTPLERGQLPPYRFSAVHLSPFGQAGLGLGSPLHLLHDSLDMASGDPVEKHGWGTERTSIFFCSAPHYFHIQTPESLDHPKGLHRGAQRREGGCNRSFSLHKHRGLPEDVQKTNKGEKM